MPLFSPEIQLLLLTAASIGVVHTLLGPDHYLPFIVLAKERGWSRRRTLFITLSCGAGHCLGSVILGALGILMGLGLTTVNAFEALRGDAAAWLLLGFGIAYACYGIRQYRRNVVHSHPHVHADGTVHTHLHDNHGAHAHAHVKTGTKPVFASLLIIFLLGPCEALIPMLMYPAASADVAGIIAVTLTFSIVTVATMMVAVAIGFETSRHARLRMPNGLAGILSGSLIGGCGAAMLLGL